MRLIDADVLKYALGCSDEAMRFDAMIDEMPTINPSPVWTPCAEGMPEPDDGQFVNVTYECRGERKSSSATYHKLSGNYYGGDKYGSMMLGVIAWQPLPAPYRADQKEVSADDHK